MRSLAGCTRSPSPGIVTLTPSAPGKVAATTFLPAAQEVVPERLGRGMVGVAVAAVRIEIVADRATPKPLMLVVKGLACRWKVLALISLLAADEPVTMAMWLGAVSEGVMVTFWLAKTPSFTSKPRPCLLGKSPLDRYCLMRLGTASSREMRITDGACHRRTLPLLDGQGHAFRLPLRRACRDWPRFLRLGELLYTVLLLVRVTARMDCITGWATRPQPNHPP